MSKFKVGDTVMVRYWDDMEREYGLDGEGDINIHPYFVKDMQKYCGQISKIEEIGFNGKIRLEIDGGGWEFSDGMLVLVEAAKEEPPEEKSDEKPKACPLCGWKVEAYRGEYKVVKNSLFIETVLHCQGCGLELKRKTEINCDGGGVIHDGYAEAVADWNRRAGNEKPM